jgi:two-component system cell cycle sensor histidine kinase/response regulator CckA
MSDITYAGRTRGRRPSDADGQGLYRMLGEAVPGLVWVTDAGGTFTYVNARWEAYTGASLDQLHALGWEVFIHPEEAEQFRNHWSEAKGRAQPFEMELRYRRADGAFCWLLTRVAPLFSPSSELEAWLTTAIDIEEQKKAHETLSQREQELEDFIENAAIPIHCFGPDGTILRVNQAELDLMGYQRDEYLGRNIADFHVSRTVIEDILARLTRGEVLQDYPAQLRAKNGSIVDVLIDASVYFQSGEFLHTRCFTRDVSRQREAEHATQRLGAIVASSADAIIGKTVDGVVTSWNAAAEQMFGYSAEEMVGGSIFKLIPDHLHHEERDLLDRIRQGERVGFAEAERIRKDGGRIHVAVSVSPIRNAQGEVIGASSIKRDVTERRQAQQALAQSQERLELALRSARMGTWQWNLETAAVSWDEGMNQLFGIPLNQQITRFDQVLERVVNEDRDTVQRDIQRTMDESGLFSSEFRVILPNGKIRWLSGTGRLMRDSTGAPLYLTGVCLDVTDRRLMEERLRQAQRMDSVGQLAGGIAHEANNMMSVVLGCADYVLQRTDLPDQVRQDVDQIWRAAKRTAGITQQLLAFSRRQMLQPQVLDLNATVRELEPILNRALGETRAVRMHLAPALGSIRADPGQLEQVLLNLTLNARDAMDQGGRLTIETMNVALDPAYVAAKPVETLEPGEYAALVVTDTGHGMEGTTLSRIFEPFFTTKAVGQGTGLGLSTVYGIVKQSGGFIWAYSEPGLGTTFKVYFPIVDAGVHTYDPAQPPPAGRPEEVVLVAEDEPMVRSIVARTLEGCGYGVLEAADGNEAIRLLEREEGKINLIVADVVMPDMGGREMADIVAQRWPGIPVLFTSGYTGLDVMRRGLLQEGSEFIQKPLEPEALARKVRDLVDATKSNP